jgi:hypothetical protein
MFELKVRKHFAALFLVSGIYLVLGFVLLINIGLLGGWQSGKLLGIISSYPNPGNMFIRFFILMLFFNIGAAYTMWRIRSRFKKLQDRPYEQLKMALISRVVVVAAISICSGLMLVIVDIFWAFFQES